MYKVIVVFSSDFFLYFPRVELIIRFIKSYEVNFLLFYLTIRIFPKPCRVNQGLYLQILFFNFVITKLLKKALIIFKLIKQFIFNFIFLFEVIDYKMLQVEKNMSNKKNCRRYKWKIVF